jgi:hypothetical protein
MIENSKNGCLKFYSAVCITPLIDSPYPYIGMQDEKWSDCDMPILNKALTSRAIKRLSHENVR